MRNLVLGILSALLGAVLVGMAWFIVMPRIDWGALRNGLAQLRARHRAGPGLPLGGAPSLRGAARQQAETRMGMHRDVGCGRCGFVPRLAQPTAAALDRQG